MNIVVCPLVSRDIYKATRAVNSCLNLFKTAIEFTVVPIINSLDAVFIQEFIDWCIQNNIQFKITASNGTPAKGKNECINFFKKSNFDGMCMLDGDDMYYPSASQQIEKHLLHHPGTDLLIVKPSDQIVGFDAHASQYIKDNIYAICWSDNIYKMPYFYGPDRHRCIDDRSAASNLGGHAFYSKKLVNKVSYDENQLLGEDLLFEFECLKLHQKGEIAFWLSFASDVQFLDRTGFDNIQSQQNENQGNFYYDRLINKLSQMMPLNRTSFNELPVEFPEMIFNYEQKINWIKSIV